MPGETPRQRADDGVFRFPGRIGIEIEHVVIVDAVVDGAVGQHVPHRLHKASRDKPGVGQREAKQLIGNGFVVGLRKAAVRNWFRFIVPP